MLIYTEGSCFVGANGPLADKKSRYAYSVYTSDNKKAGPTKIVMSELFNGCNNEAELLAIIAVYKKYPYAHFIYTDWHTMFSILEKRKEDLLAADPYEVFPADGRHLTDVINRCSLLNIDLRLLTNLIKKYQQQKQTYIGRGTMSYTNC
jgi:hypothetical protein